MIAIVTLGLSCAILAAVGFWHGTRMYQLGLKAGRKCETSDDQIPRARTMSEHDRMLLNRVVHLTRIAAQMGIENRETVASLILADAVDGIVSRTMVQISDQLHQAVLQLLAGKLTP